MKGMKRRVGWRRGVGATGEVRANHRQKVILKPGWRLKCSTGKDNKQIEKGGDGKMLQPQKGQEKKGVAVRTRKEFVNM